MKYKKFQKIEFNIRNDIILEINTFFDKDCEIFSFHNPFILSSDGDTNQVIASIQKEGINIMWEWDPGYGEDPCPLNELNTTVLLVLLEQMEKEEGDWI